MNNMNMSRAEARRRIGELKAAMRGGLTTPRADDMIKVIDEWANGKAIQWRLAECSALDSYDCDWKDVTTDGPISFNPTFYDWRVKPDSKPTFPDRVIVHFIGGEPIGVHTIEYQKQLNAAGVALAGELLMYRRDQ